MQKIITWESFIITFQREVGSIVINYLLSGIGFAINRERSRPIIRNMCRR